MSLNTNMFANPSSSHTSVRMYIAIFLSLTFIVAITIFQDLVESYRSDYSFYFSESFLFKTTWFLFIPFLYILYINLSTGRILNRRSTFLYIVIPVLLHYLIFPLIARGITILFYDGRYDLYKFYSYTLAHDLYKLVIVYAGFVLLYPYFQRQQKVTKQTNLPGAIKKIIINNGAENTIINVEDIYQITAATPYIYIHCEKKKHIYSQTLKSIHSTLDPITFIRVHKSALVNTSKIKSFKSRLNGDYDLILTNGDSVRLSRTYAADFKNDFFISPQVKD